MDTHEATTIVMSRIKGLDPENASKIMGYILIQDPGEKEMIRLAYGPDSLLLSYINQGKAYAKRLSNSPSPFPRTSQRILIPSNNGFNLSNPSSPAAVSYDAVFNGGYGFGDEFLSDPIMSPSGGSDPLVFPYGGDANTVPSPRPLQKPCMFFAQGICKNGSSCKFLHGEIDGCEAIENEEFMRMKALQEQRFALMASVDHRSYADNDFMSFLNENQRYDFSPMGLGDGEDPSSRQIYLTFASDSVFNEEDVSDYFSTFGPVQDVRIPYQQKRMFGFVTFLYPDTVKHILEVGNPHNVCNSRVLVKRYKDKKQLMERGEYPGNDSRELLNNPIGPRLLIKKQKMMLRRKMEQEVELQNALELQRRRMMNLQLMGTRNEYHNRQFLPFQRARFPISPPRQPQFLMIQNVPSDATNQEVLQDGQKAYNSPAVAAENQSDSGNEQWHLNDDDSDLPESLEHALLPDDLFASPTKVSGERKSVFGPAEADDNLFITTNTSVQPRSSPLGMASPCYFQITRQEAIQMCKNGSE